MPAPKDITRLVEQFERNADAYRSPGYNETQVRREFIDPFFGCLGWDIDNKQGFAEAYKDVVHEDAIKIGGATKAPDYCFRVGGTRKFFLEAKKPAVNVKQDPEPAYQLRRYAWSAGLPLSILTDFEEFAVYDCRVKPAFGDKASAGRTLYMTFTDYRERWDDIAGVFARDAVYKGSFDKYAEGTKAKRGTATVDAAFLQEIEGWRDLLARNFALRNPRLSQRELNVAVQLTIDRLLFLRMCEDRGIEQYGQLLGYANGDKVYAKLFQLFRAADDRYNSGLFYFHKDAGRTEPPDELTPSLKLDDKPLKDILHTLYYPECPYEFSVLPAEILGQVYEQFLGKVIRLTEGHQAKIEEKPEVRKAGGVYYTPTYIVDYIVKNTVGKLLGNVVLSLRERNAEPASDDIQQPDAANLSRSERTTLTPKQAAKLRILDPACGSGSFLLGAYQFLLDWHRDWYVADGPDKHPKELYQGPGNVWRLTTAEKRRILLNNIYGVDIDPQAVETTKLSLLLKVLEGESKQTLEKQLLLFHERALPDLASNIKCGNSLIGPDFYDNQQGTLFDDEERYRINVFDWNAEFPTIMKAGGFDAVIGNPPYGASVGEPDADYIRAGFAATSKDIDTYCIFMEQATRLARPDGKIAMIVPTGWYSGAKFSLLRRFMATRTDPEVFVNLPYDVFHAWVDTTVFVATKRATHSPWPRTKPCTVRIRTFAKRHRIVNATEIEHDQRLASFTDWFEKDSDEYLSYADIGTTSIIRKIKTIGKPLSEFSDVQRGVTPFSLTESPTHQTSRQGFAGSVRRYRMEVGPKRYIRFDHTLAEPKPERYFQGPRLLLRELISRQFQLQAVFVEDDFVTNKSMQSILGVSGGPDLKYLLGFINSHLMSWFFLHRSNVAQRDDFPKIVLKETRSLPIAPVDQEKKSRASHDRMVQLVNQMLTLHERLAAAKTGHDKTALERQIAATDRQIDRLVYELYGLTEAEIKIVEEGTAT